jgi:hypothetical protein
MSMPPLVLCSLGTEELIAARILGGSLLLMRALHEKGGRTATVPHDLVGHLSFALAQATIAGNG